MAETENSGTKVPTFNFPELTGTQDQNIRFVTKKTTAELSAELEATKTLITDQNQKIDKLAAAISTLAQRVMVSATPPTPNHAAPFSTQNTTAVSQTSNDMVGAIRGLAELMQLTYTLKKQAREDVLADISIGQQFGAPYDDDDGVEDMGGVAEVIQGLASLRASATAPLPPMTPIPPNPLPNAPVPIPNDEGEE